MPSPAALSGAVVCEQLRASQVGTSILAAGGNAADAIVASVLAVNTLAPYHSDIGGGGFAIIRDGEGKHTVLDFRHTAPAAATSDFYRDPAVSTSIGGAAVAVPGEVRGLEELHKRYGRLPWSTLVEPSIRLAEEGFEVRGDLHEFITGEYSWTQSDPAFVSLLSDGQPLSVGSTWRRPEYAQTLRRIAQGGADAFYNGEVAQGIVQAVGDRGGLMILDDLKDYKVIWREPLSIKYRDHTLWAPPAPASGAIWLSAMGILAQQEPKESGSVKDLHRLTETLRLAYGQRTALGDPAFVPGLEAQQSSWLKPAAIAQRASLITDRTHEPDYYKPPRVEIVEDHGTVNVTAADSSGLVISITTTVGLGWGSRIIVPGYGMVLNDSMDDFSVEGRPNGTGYEPQVANYVRGGKRPLSSSCPYIVESASGQPVLVGGAAGGSTIISANVQVSRNVLDYGMTSSEALRAIRLHNQILPNVSVVERASSHQGIDIAGFSEEQAKGLESRGHTLEWTERNRSMACAITFGRDEATGEVSWDAQGEPRRNDSGGSVYTTGRAKSATDWSVK